MAKKFSEFTKFCTKIIGVGRNYVAHAHELGNQPPTRPILFLKPPSAFIHSGDSIRMPYLSDNLHHEIELGVVIGARGSNISKEKAMDFVAGYCLALDMTARDLQNEAKDKRLPWANAKGFDTACPVSDFVDKSAVDDVNDICLKLTVADEVRQSASCDLMIYDVPTLIHYISHYYTLEPGDLILTGTPAGVAQVGVGDTLYSEMRTKDGTLKISMQNDVVPHPTTDSKSKL